MKSGALLWLSLLFFCTGLFGCGAKTLKGLPPGWIREEFPQEYALPISKLESEGQRNWVLNLNELAVQALRNNNRDLAILALDEAILEIEVIYGDSDQARQARSVWRSEGRKIFKGDPYERSMTYFYRGILYMQEQAWDNARACFRSALYQDAFAEDQNYNADWATFEYLIGVCEVQLRDTSDAHDSFNRALKNYEQFQASQGGTAPTPRYVADSSSNVKPAPAPAFGTVLPPVTEKTNLLVLTQQGRAPIKKAVGDYNELLTYEQGGGGANPLNVTLDSKPLRLVLTDSVFYQAKTRGGRPLDSVLRGQARFKEVGEKFGTTSVQAGSVILMSGGNKKDDEAAVIIGGGLVVLGAISYGIASLVRPEADTRQWKSLPDSLALWAGSVPKSEILLEAQTPSAQDQAVRQVPLPAPGNGLQVILVFSPPGGTILLNKDSDVQPTG